MFKLPAALLDLLHVWKNVLVEGPRRWRHCTAWDVCLNPQCPLWHQKEFYFPTDIPVSALFSIFFRNCAVGRRSKSSDFYSISCESADKLRLLLENIRKVNSASYGTFNGTSNAKRHRGRASGRAFQPFSALARTSPDVSWKLLSMSLDPAEGKSSPGGEGLCGWGRKGGGGGNPSRDQNTPQRVTLAGVVLHFGSLILCCIIWIKGSEEKHRHKRFRSSQTTWKLCSSKNYGTASNGRQDLTGSAAIERRRGGDAGDENLL